MNETHKTFMQRALTLAQQGKGRTSPNPLVGAVIVNAGKIVGEGYHQEVGGPHAKFTLCNRLMRKQWVAHFM